MLFAVPEQVNAGSPHRHRIASAPPRFRRTHRPGDCERVTLSINGARLTADAQETSFCCCPLRSKQFQLRQACPMAAQSREPSSSCGPAAVNADRQQHPAEHKKGDLTIEDPVGLSRSCGRGVAGRKLRPHAGHRTAQEI